MWAWQILPRGGGGEPRLGPGSLLSASRRWQTSHHATTGGREIVTPPWNFRRKPVEFQYEIVPQGSVVARDQTWGVHMLHPMCSHAPDASPTPARHRKPARAV